METGGKGVLLATHELDLKFYWLASIFILFYDWAITLDAEVHTMWLRRRLTLAHALFFVNRYFPLVAYGVVLGYVLNPRVPAEVCRAFLVFPPVAMYINDAVMGAIIIIRTHALYRGSQWILATMCISYFAALVFGGFVTFSATQSPDWLGRYGCVTSYPRQRFWQLGFLWPAQVIFDLLMLLLTLNATLRIREDAGGHKIPLIELIHRDGVLYFVVMFGAKVINLIVFITTDPDLTNINWVFNQTICIVMVSRIVLNIREEITGRSHRFPLPEIKDLSSA